MPKADVGGLKALAKAQKQKGLQRLRWYCQACEKQCRDENGFKCHAESAGHLRRLAELRANPDAHVARFSDQFLKSFLAHLRHAHRFSRVLANYAYNEFIADRHHVHMNATRWTTLTEFVKYLGAEGLCEIDETERGWHIKYIDKADPFASLAVNNRAAKEDASAADARQARQLAAQAERARLEASAAVALEGNAAPSSREADAGPVRLQLGAAAGAAASAGPPPLPSAGRASVFGSAEVDDAVPSKGLKRVRPRDTASPSSGGAVAAIMREEEEARRKQRRHAAAEAAGADGVPRDCWLRRGIIVKLVDSHLEALGYLGAKATVTEWDAASPRIARVTVLSLRNPPTGAKARVGAKLEVDQAHVETVLPGLEGRVMVVNRASRFAGRVGRLVGISESTFEAIVHLDGSAEDSANDRFAYEDVCKVDVETPA